MSVRARSTMHRLPRPSHRQRSRARLWLLGVVVAAGVLAAGCSSGDDSSAKATTTTAGNVTSSTVATGTGGSAGNTGSSSGGQSNTGTTAPSGPAPTINSFVTPDNIDCHNGNSQNFSASWTTTNAVKTTISIDGSGVYKTYGANGSDSLPFNCSSAHTFLLTAYGQDGRTATKSITLQPRNVQTTTTDSQPGTTTTS